MRDKVIEEVAGIGGDNDLTPHPEDEAAFVATMVNRKRATHIRRSKVEQIKSRQTLKVNPDNGKRRSTKADLSMSSLFFGSSLIFQLMLCYFVTRSCWPTTTTFMLAEGML